MAYLAAVRSLVVSELELRPHALHAGGHAAGARAVGARDRDQRALRLEERGGTAGHDKSGKKREDSGHREILPLDSHRLDTKNNFGSSKTKEIHP
jgi:hypothetical protein